MKGVLTILRIQIKYAKKNSSLEEEEEEEKKKQSGKKGANKEAINAKRNKNKSYLC